MNKVIKTDFVLGKLDGKRYEQVAVELRNRLRRGVKLKDHVETILETFNDVTSAMLFNTLTGLIDKMFSGLEYELENLFWEPTVFADRSTGRFVSVVFLLGDCRLNETARLSFDVALDIGGKAGIFKERREQRLLETDRSMFVDRPATPEAAVSHSGWLTRWRGASLNKLAVQLNDLESITSSFVSRYINSEAREDSEVNFNVEVLTIQTPLVVSVRHTAVSKELTIDELATTQAIVSVCLEIPQDYYSA